jgi:hypothetical protein
VKVPRTRIAWVMLAIAITALDFWAIRACFDLYGSWAELLLLGALPMANVLAVGLLVAQQRPKSRPFLLGFETFGAAALALFAVLVICFRRETVTPYVDLALRPVFRIIGLDPPWVYVLTACFVIVVVLGLPQLAVALIGGFLSRKFKVTNTRR